MDAELTESNGRNQLTLERRFADPLELVWRSLVEPDRLSVWHPATVVGLRAVVGVPFTLDYGHGAVTRGAVTEVDEHRVFAYREESLAAMPREGDNLLRFELRDDPPGCVLTLTHEFDDRPAAASYAAGWDACLDLLDDALAERPADPAMPSVERHQHYTHALGLDEPSLRGAVLVERQLMMQSPDKVWRMLAPHGAPAPDWLAPTGLAGVIAVEVVQGESVTVDLVDGGRIRWEIGTGPGGARLLVTHSALHGDVDTVRQLWRDHIERFVAGLIRSQ